MGGMSQNVVIRLGTTLMHDACTYVLCSAGSLEFGASTSRKKNFFSINVLDAACGVCSHWICFH